MTLLAPKFYRRDTTTVAKELLGKKLFHKIQGKLIGEEHIQTTPRIGIPYAKEAITWPLRFLIDPKKLEISR